MAVVRLWAGQAVALALLLSTSFAVGRVALRLVGLRLESRWENLAVSTALGSALGGQALWLLAAAGSLRLGAVLTLVALAHVVALSTWPPRPWVAPSPSSMRLAVVATLLLLPCFALTLYPPHSFDELTYHLPFASGLAATGHLSFHDELRAPVFPQLAEALFAALLLTGGKTATHVVQFAAALATGGLLLVWVRRRLTWAGLLAAAVFLGSPIVVFYAATGFVDLVLALFVALSVWALERGAEPGDRDWRWAALAGYAAGSAAAVKYLGLLAIMVGGVMVLFWRQALRQRVNAVGAYGIAAALAAGPTYAWNLLVTGNPLSPFLAAWFGASAWEPMSDLLIGTARWRSILWPVDAVFARANVNWQPPYHPAFLLALPVAIWGALRFRRARWLATIALVWTATMPLLPADSRYGLPALPLWLAAAAAALAHGRLRRSLGTEVGRVPGRGPWVPVLTAVLMAGGPAYAISKWVLWGAPPADRAATERFLTVRLPEYELIRGVVNDAAAPTVYMYGGENLRGLFRGRVLGEVSGPFEYSRIADLATGSSPDALCRVLQTWGVERFVWLSRMSPPPVSLGGRGFCFEELQRDRHGAVWRVAQRAGPDLRHP